jgi:hypothetical protein
LYFAFPIPVTVATFAIWAAMTQRRQMDGLIKQLAGRL